MADIRINQLPAEASPVATDVLAIDGATVGGSTRKTTIQDAVLIGRPAASQAEAEAGTESVKAMTPLTTSQAVAFYGLTKAGNLDGLTNTTTARSNLGLGSAAVESASSFATSAQGSLADTSLQPAAIGSTVAAQNDRRFVQSLVADGSNVLPGDGLAQRRFVITGDDIDAEADGIIARGYRLAHTFGGATMTAARIAAEFSAIHEAPDDPTNSVPDGVALTASYYGTSSGGWGGSMGSPRGNAFAFNAIVTTQSGYTFLDNVTGGEFNTQMETGSSARYKSIIQLVSRDQVHASEIDAHLALSSITGAVGSKHGISFGDMNGDPPVTSDGTLIASFTDDGVTLLDAAIGIDFTAWAFSDSVLKSGGYTIKAGGNVVAGSQAVAQVQYDFKTSGPGSAFDARIAVSGGSGSNGTGLMTIVCGRLELPNQAGAPSAAGFYTLSADTGNAYYRVKIGGSIYRATLPLTIEP